MFDRMLSAAADAPLVAYLYTREVSVSPRCCVMPPGQAELAGRNVVHLDVRFLGAEPRCVEEAAAPACVQSGTVLLLDSFEHCQQLERWLRNTFMLQLAQVHSLSSQAGLPRCRMVTGSLLSAARRRNRRAAA
ncbi:hypothetical protein [Streptomyces coeruleorubidus]|uniref:hypothetical protein n=1 Tax=Streptomyces coeruleorubidus TaxID=116188 RepID=UPI003654DCC9